MNLDEARDRLNGAEDDLQDARASYGVWLGMLVQRTTECTTAARLLACAEAVVERLKIVKYAEEKIASAQAAVNAAREAS